MRTQRVRAGYWIPLSVVAALACFAAESTTTPDGSSQDGGEQTPHVAHDGPVDHSNQDCTDDGFATVLYVDAGATGLETGLCWQNAFRHLVDALGAAAEPNSTVQEIWVARGVYLPDQGTLDRAASFRLPDGVAIYGGFSGLEKKRSGRIADPAVNGTVLSGDLLGDDGPDFVNRMDNSFHVVVADGVSDATVLDGFTIRGGYADGLDGNLNDRGGGLLALNAAAQVRNVIITDNYAVIGGGAYLDGGAMLISDALFIQNMAEEAPALFVGESSQATLESVTFVDNIDIE